MFGETRVTAIEKNLGSGLGSPSRLSLSRRLEELIGRLQEAGLALGGTGVKGVSIDVGTGHFLTGSKLEMTDQIRFHSVLLDTCCCFLAIDVVVDRQSLPVTSAADERVFQHSTSTTYAEAKRYMS